VKLNFSIMSWYLAVIFILVMVSIIAGQSAAPSGGVGNKDCKGCEEDFKWYASLKRARKLAYAAWWAARKASCALNGC
jgi:hypothetical protein